MTDAEERRLKFEEIVSILIGAGYFRANITTLSEFDKAVGGLCWAIVNSGVDVDADILFQENSTIGQRIALSEAVVGAIRKMRCPHNLQPHQIQGGIGGSDWTALLPVLVWLIEKFSEHREEREVQIRAQSLLQFSKNYKFPDEAEINNVTPELAKVLGRNFVKRKFRRSSAKSESEETKVHSCLLEYGEKSTLNGVDSNAKKDKNGNAIDSAEAYSVSLNENDFSGFGKGESGELSGFEKKLMQEAKKAQKEEAKYNEMISKEESELMESMTSWDDSQNFIGGSNVGSLIGLGSSDISAAAAGYSQDKEDSRKKLESSIQEGKMGQQAIYKRQKQNLTKQRDVVGTQSLEKEMEVNMVLEKLTLLEEETKDAISYNEKLQQQIAKLNELEKKSAQQDDLKELKRLIILNENLKSQENAFKASCKAQIGEYNAKIEKLKDESKDDSESNKKLVDIEEMHSKILMKYNRLRSVLAETNLEVSSNARIIDDIPTRTELIQYERRFVELYQQVAWKLEETKKYYAMYNTLDTSLTFMQKNCKVLDSIYENFSESMKSSEGKELFLTQVRTITKGVEDSLANQVDVLNQRSTQVARLKQTYQNLVDEQRSYYQAIKDFQNECEKSEYIQSKLTALES